MSADFTTTATAVLHGGPKDGCEKPLAFETADRRRRLSIQKELALLQDGVVHVYLLTPWANTIEDAAARRYHYTYNCTFKAFAA